MKAICIKRYKCKVTNQWVEVDDKPELTNERFTELSEKGYVKCLRGRKKKKK